MKVVHLSTYAHGGGAAIATYRIHKKLIEKGVDSTMFVLHPPSIPLENVVTIYPTRWEKVRNLIFSNFEETFSKKYSTKQLASFSFNFFPHISLKNIKEIEEADVVCLYWIGRGLLTPEQIASIKKPIIWRLSDMWAFTGGCHYAGACKNFEDNCGKCPQLNSKDENDITNIFWRKKNKAWAKKDLAIVCPSRWMKDKVLRSSLLSKKNVTHIATGVEHTIFKPVDKNFAKKYFDIDPSSKVILFGSIDDVERKGGSFLPNLIKALGSNNFVFLIFGPKPKIKLPDLYKEIYYTGYIQDEISLSLIYNAADVFFAPSLEDNLPNTVLESMACGTPSIAFKDSGGVEDAIMHQQNGYLAKMDDVNDIVKGITWIINSNLNSEISDAARKMILENFTLDAQVNKYVELYQAVINKTDVKDKKPSL